MELVLYCSERQLAPFIASENSASFRSNVCKASETVLVQVLKRSIYTIPTRALEQLCDETL